MPTTPEPLKLQIDKEFNDLLPELTEEELAALEADMAIDKKAREPLLYWMDGTRPLVIDGMNRLRICRKNDWKYTSQRKHFETRQDVKIWIVKNQLGRRNLNESQKAMQAAKLTALRNGEASNGADQSSALTVEEAAEAVGASPRMVEMSRKVLDKGVPELARAVERGDVKASAAAKVAELPESRQAAIVAKGPDEIRAEASRRRKREADKREEKKVEKPEKPRTATQMFTECDSLFGKVIRLVDVIGRETGDKAARDEVADALDMAYRDFAKWRQKAKKEAKK